MALCLLAGQPRDARRAARLIRMQTELVLLAVELNPAVPHLSNRRQLPRVLLL